MGWGGRRTEWGDDRVAGEWGAGMTGWQEDGVAGGEVPAEASGQCGSGRVASPEPHDFPVVPESQALMVEV